MTTLIRMEGIKKVFYTDEVETHALSDVHFEIKKGEYVAISGPSGCGKTTLLSILGLLDAPSGGKYELAGQAVATLGPAERINVQFGRASVNAIEVLRGLQPGDRVIISDMSQWDHVPRVRIR